MTVNETHLIFLEQAIIEATQVVAQLQGSLAILRDVPPNKRDAEARHIAQLNAAAMRHIIAARVAAESLQTCVRDSRLPGTSETT